MKKKILGIVVICGMAASLLAGCGSGSKAVTAQSLIEDATANMEDVSSQSMNMTMDIVASIEDYGSMDMGMDLDIDATTDPEASYVSGTISILGQNIDFESYTLDEDGQTTSYTGMYGEWTVDTTDTYGDIAPAGSGILDYIDSLELEEETDEVNGTECYIISGTVSGDDMDDIVDTVDDLVGSMMSGIEEMDTDDVSISLEYAIGKDDHMPVKLSLSFDGLGASVEGMDFSYDELSLELTYKGFDTIDEITVPQDVLDAVSEDGGDDEDLYAEEEEILEEAEEEAEGSTAAASAGGTYDIDNAEIYNADGVVITATGYDPDGMYGPEVEFSIVNGSDQNITVSSNEVAVNGCMTTYSMLYESVAAGKSANTSLEIDEDDLDLYGISSVSSVTFDLSIYDSDSYDDILEDGAPITLNVADGGSQAVDDSGTEIYNSDGIRLVYQGTSDDSYIDYGWTLYAENNTSRTVMLYAGDIYVNDYKASGSYITVLFPGCVCIDTLELYDLDGLDIDDISDAENIEFTLDAYDEYSYEDVISGDTVTIGLK